ncbi:MAG: T9SS type A sorting domain-containing protein [Pseudomonadota bacterium]
MATNEKFPGADAVKEELKLDTLTQGDIGKANEHDWIKVTLPSKGQLWVSGASTGNGTLVDPTVDVYSADGKMLKSITRGNFGVGKNEALSLFDAGTYYVRIKSADPKATGTYSVVARTFELDGDLANVSRLERNRNTKRVLKDGQTAHDRSDLSYDVDPYKVELVAGRRYTFTSTPDASKGAAMFGSTLMLYNDKDEKLAGETNGEISDTLTFEAKESGTYYLTVASGLYRFGDYKVSMSSVGPAPKDDFAGDATTKRAAKMGEVISGNIETAGDQDWVKVQLERGKQYQVVAAGVGSGVGTLADPDIEVVDANGKPVQFFSSRADWGQGQDELKRYMHIGVESGEYFVRVKSGSADGTGTYKFAIRERSTQDDGDATVNNHKNLLEEGGTAKGSLIFADSDQYQAYLTKGRQYSFTLEADNSGAAGIARRPNIQVLDGLGNTIDAKLTNADGKTTVTFTASETDYAYFKFNNPTYLDGGDYIVSLTGKEAPAPKPQSLRSVSQSLSAAGQAPAAERAEPSADAIVAAGASAPAPEAAPSAGLTNVAAGLGASNSAPSAGSCDSRRLNGAAGLASA